MPPFLHGLSLLLANSSQINVLLGEGLRAGSLAAIIQRLNRATARKSDRSTVVLGLSPEIDGGSCARWRNKRFYFPLEKGGGHQHRPYPDDELHQAATSPTSVSGYTRSPSSWAL
ncbi:uncharacterized protein PADG_02420 [Paracoccidioides brasiliensis Pb18]|uniref:Uncharacterized protein n=1 Tax=Paracoccidioides brasiliensis (strain Pb18) TaxID=502780 RepID=C1G5G5_PARBD|nr:uncharacterized protein PADG_02420 [Paracoccidioides brasiliensis Pb18]EEH46322.2 hypothetical protein PADG_02420 [Paracoccidioides brasiliensis Pb18]